LKFNFKIQGYQTDAVESTVGIFNGQPHYDRTSYIRDLGKTTPQPAQIQLSMIDEYGEQIDIENETGFKNDNIDLSDEQILRNIREMQTLNNIKLSDDIAKHLGRCSLDIEMETGTGKTYVYIKTMFELNKRYGWSKFIVVVPSIAIREGVKKSFEMTVDHFMEHYGKKARFFIYNSSNLNQLDNFSSSNGINVMIINTQAFASSLKEDGKSKESRIIYSKRDEFGSRRPIDVISANRPIIILDEPQKMGGEVTQKALKSFNPLFCLNYSATHKDHHNLVYVLDALDAYNKRLVKKIEVKGFEVKNFRGTDQYLYLENIVLSSKKPPMARLEFEIAYNKSINRETRLLGVGDNLYYLSNEMEQYQGYTISEIDPIGGTVTFTNGEVIAKGDIVGDISEKDMRRIQIRETIISHFKKEETLFNKGIKTLSLFFIDEVAKYRQYDEDGNEQLGEYGQMFEQEYISVLNDYINLFDTPYQQYLKGIEVADTHKGYFSIDKKTGHSVDSDLKRGAEFSDDISAYDLILKNKEQLLSFEEPTRFIFSHSALREGWDNPNVFQICTLKHSDNATAKRQEVGRGMRLCVDKEGNRMDAETCGATVHSINMLTVIAHPPQRRLQLQPPGAILNATTLCAADLSDGGGQQIGHIAQFHLDLSRVGHHLFCRGGGCGSADICSEISKGKICIMPNTSDHWYLRIRDGAHDSFVIKCPQILEGTPASGHNDDIGLVLRVQGCQRFHNLRRGVFSLHRAGRQNNLNQRKAPLQCIQYILQRRSAGRGDQPDSRRLFR